MKAIFSSGKKPPRAASGNVRGTLIEYIADNMTLGGTTVLSTPNSIAPEVYIQPLNATTVNLGGQALNGDLLSEVLVRRQSVVISNLQQADLPAEMKAFAEKHSVVSLLAVPAPARDRVRSETEVGAVTV